MFIKLEKGATGKIDDVGGKGYSLLTLVNLGYSVPCGFIVSSNHFIEMLKINGVYNNVVNICNDTTLGNFKENSIALQNLVMQCDMPFNNSELLSDLSTLVSIRSSAVSEDGKNHSFAGLHDSFLNVGTDNVLLNIKKAAAPESFRHPDYYHILGVTKKSEKLLRNLPEYSVTKFSDLKSLQDFHQNALAADRQSAVLASAVHAMPHVPFGCGKLIKV